MRIVPSLRRALARPDSSAARRRASRGQSLAELALVTPVLLLIVLAGIDFGRIYLGFVNLQQMARIAANFAADNASAWDTTPKPEVQQRYQELIDNDARAINCELPRDADDKLDVPDPVFASGFDLGDPVEVRIDCTFGVITPVIGVVVGGAVQVGDGATFPVKEGVVATLPGGGGGTIAAPTADFAGSPRSGYGSDAVPLEVTFEDLSLNAPTSWQWNLGNGSFPTGQGPHVGSFGCTGAPGTVCTFDVALTVGNSGGFNTKTEVDYVTVTVPPDSGPVAEFSATTPTAGSAPLTVSFEVVDVTPDVTETTWDWDFDGDGSPDDTGENVSYTFTAVGPHDVTLTATDDTGATNSQTKVAYVTVAERVCTVPDFQGVKVSAAQLRWAAEGFTTTVTKAPPPAKGAADYKITKQSILGGTIDPQPDGCDSTIAVGW